MGCGCLHYLYLTCDLMLLSLEFGAVNDDLVFVMLYYRLVFAIAFLFLGLFTCWFDLDLF